MFIFHFWFKIVFTPTFEEVELALLETYDTVLRGASEIPRYQYDFNTVNPT